ncbi:hypothetical protein [Bradyrhizobium sp. RDM4]|uniref:hypothetical protein n=1 Tax=Bradyrhizobium sp. RDM4 TaxID=3378765 RepID=UPI0038FCE6E6
MNDELESVSGGNQISILTKMPNYQGPKFHVPGSIAQGDTLDNTLTFDQLP